MNKVRPKTVCMYSLKGLLGEAICFIHCYPQQKWEYRVKGNKVTLERKGISLTIPKADFDKYWKVIE